MPKAKLSIILAFLLPTIPAPSNAQGYCLEPPEPFLDALSRNDPLYGTARDEAQRYFEDMEDYLRCLEHERAAAYARLTRNYQIFQQNFKNEAAFEYNLDDDRRRENRTR